MCDDRMLSQVAKQQERKERTTNHHPFLLLSYPLILLLLLLLLLLSLLPSMSSLVGSQGMAWATAVALSGAVLLVTLFRPRLPVSDKLTLRPCISSNGSKREKGKRVHFAEDLVVEFEDVDQYEEEEEVESQSMRFRNVGRIPGNRLAVYNGILHDRMGRMVCSC
ncbi:hypothetical protein IHE45_05G071200 [Dioscorea alata]|uniref:Uncharacterized protein n=1 Tax=Dioscorea alata TaxID=55571 RepID=A0ACB7W2R2_DIOAL|nr:hypothetical protein IHE45_05G071200 [Dioscorea alata]